MCSLFRVYMAIGCKTAESLSFPPLLRNARLFRPWGVVTHGKKSDSASGDSGRPTKLHPPFDDSHGPHRYFRATSMLSRRILLRVFRPPRRNSRGSKQLFSRIP